jgi:hypothetical protein
MTDKKTTIDLNKLVDEIVQVRDKDKVEYEYSRIRFEALLRDLKEQIEKLCVQTGGYTIFSVHPEYPVLEEFRKFDYSDRVYLPTIYQGQLVLDQYGYSKEETRKEYPRGSSQMVETKVPEHMYHDSQYGDKDVFDKFYRRHLKYINKPIVEALLKAILKETKELTASRLNELDTIRQTIKNIDELGVS